jgi:D-arabinitol dehydrogenase (NADP+)
LDAVRADGTDGYDAVIGATGALSVAEMCLLLTRDGGTVLIYGMAGEEEP